jgi:hypothetical protein
MKWTKLLWIVLFFVACKRYKDPSPFTDSRINTPYCNIPSAINYNWNFPGVEDNSTCIYPAQIFGGTYFYRDTIIDSAGAVLNIDSFPITLQALDSSHLNIIGFCGTEIHKANANRYYTFTLDSLVGFGQSKCIGSADTISGKGYKPAGLGDTASFLLNYIIQTPTGTTIHKGVATKQ